MSMKECTIAKKQPGEKMADHEDVLASAQPFGQMGRREAIASATRSPALDETRFVTGAARSLMTA